MPDLLKPPPLRQGDRVGVIAPASPPKAPEDLANGLSALRERSMKLVQLRDFDEHHGYLCGTDDERLRELNTFFRRDDLHALLCVRGGFGCLRLLPHLDYEAARAHPKLLVGYSDITALQLALYRRTGLPSLSGPMVAADWKDIDVHTERLFWEMAGGATPQPLLGPEEEALQPVHPGTAEGVLLGGNLSMVQRLIGTPYLPDLEGAILFVEDIGEKPYHIDAILAHLRLSGHLAQLGGLVFGAFTDWELPHDRPTFTPNEVLDQYAAKLDIPVARGLIYGHFPIKNSLPIGVQARLEVTEDDAALSILEPVVQREDAT